MSVVPSTAAALPVRRSVAEMGPRVAVSIASVFGLAIFLLLYFAFWTGSFSWLQSLVVVVVAILAFIGINGAAWASWGVRYGRRAEAGD
jgi:hypothetical protein